MRALGVVHSRPQTCAHAARLRGRIGGARVSGAEIQCLSLVAVGVHLSGQSKRVGVPAWVRGGIIATLLPASMLGCAYHGDDVIDAHYQR